MTDDNLCAWLRTHRINTGVSAECERALKAADRIETLAAQDQHNQRRLLNAEVLNASLVERLATAEAANMVLFQQLASDAPDPDQQRSVRFNNVLSATIADLSQRLATAEAERDEARRFGAEAGQRYYNALLIASCDVTCAFCGATYPRGTPRHGDGALADHIKVCPKHPMRDAEAERDALREQVAERDAIITQLRNVPVAEDENPCIPVKDREEAAFRAGHQAGCSSAGHFWDRSQNRLAEALSAWQARQKGTHD